jgi:hypothetical protein
VANADNGATHQPNNLTVGLISSTYATVPSSPRFAGISSQRSVQHGLSNEHLVSHRDSFKEYKYCAAHLKTSPCFLPLETQIINYQPTINDTNRATAIDFTG